MRYEFGKNWESYIDGMEDSDFDEALGLAKSYLCEIFGNDGLRDKSFIDVGSGSGLFSLAAVELGARLVVSFDYDQHSINTTRALKQRKLVANEVWTVIQGDILDEELIGQLKTFDFVHCAGVAHHTGNMFQALRNLDKLVNENGQLFVSIYNKISVISNVWHKIKYLYNKFGVLRPILKFCYISFWWIYWIAKGKWPLKEIKYYGKNGRGMNFYRDIDDWLGGYPYEYASASEIYNFYFSRNYVLRYFVASSNWGLNCMVLARSVV